MYIKTLLYLDEADVNNFQDLFLAHLFPVTLDQKIMTWIIKKSELLQKRKYKMFC